eukprot:CAMPEP_0170420468 /NCGR_PEP_ID=MMETSP0117_2-20130122/35357_1 /TAXON_ID=400756 /ORGANISM="Durinskia baltica, Strain CSIRO CS-38" /LENGTH=54 /DNA_ID=CAMNT_0010678905 /DNA_START=55 /DNA_END=216 /DNA_ORIENTATION=-
MEFWGNASISAAWMNTTPLHWTELQMPSYSPSPCAINTDIASEHQQQESSMCAI